jgi:hypothetical protein
MRGQGVINCNGGITLTHNSTVSLRDNRTRWGGRALNGARVWSVGPIPDAEAGFQGSPAFAATLPSRQRIQCRGR